jgi:hypothetical protein
MEKYKQNLRLESNKVYSYNTHVATIEGSQLIQLGWWSVTTQKHINYVANELGLGLIKDENKVNANNGILRLETPPSTGFTERYALQFKTLQ